MGLSDITYDDLMAILQKRRSIRRFKADPVPEELVVKIIDAARWAPSGFNMQPWEFVVLTDDRLRAKIVEITEFYWKQSKAMEAVRPAWQGKTWKLAGMTDTAFDYTQAPVYILVLGDPRTQAGLPMGVQCDRHRRRLIYQSSLASAFLVMHLAATSLGLASQWYSAVQTPYAACLIKDLLGIPEFMDIYDMMVLGYPAIKPPGKFLRERDEIIHWNRSAAGRFRSDEAVRHFVKKARGWTIGTHRRSV
jgi:nitroreductase